MHILLSYHLIVLGQVPVTSSAPVSILNWTFVPSSFSVADHTDSSSPDNDLRWALSILISLADAIFECDKHCELK